MFVHRQSSVTQYPLLYPLWSSSFPFLVDANNVGDGLCLLFYAAFSFLHHSTEIRQSSVYLYIYDVCSVCHHVCSDGRIVCSGVVLVCSSICSSIRPSFNRRCNFPCMPILHGHLPLQLLYLQLYMPLLHSAPTPPSTAAAAEGSRGHMRSAGHFICFTSSDSSIAPAVPAGVSLSSLFLVLRFTCSIVPLQFSLLFLFWDYCVPRLLCCCIDKTSSLVLLLHPSSFIPHSSWR